MLNNYSGNLIGQRTGSHTLDIPFLVRSHTTLRDGQKNHLAYRTPMGSQCESVHFHFLVLHKGPEGKETCHESTTEPIIITTNKNKWNLCICK